VVKFVSSLFSSNGRAMCYIYPALREMKEMEAFIICRPNTAEIITTERYIVWKTCDLWVGDICMKCKTERGTR
jgi:hypothetical protein